MIGLVSRLQGVAGAAKTQASVKLHYRWASITPLLRALDAAVVTLETADDALNAADGPLVAADGA